MKKIYKTLSLVLLSTLFTASLAQAKGADPAEGLWLTENKRSVIELKQCEQGLCGYIYWIIDVGMLYDTKNPDKAKRDEPMCGLPILWGFANDGRGDWEDGKIYKADDGDMYDADVELNQDGTLHVRGYMGIALLGKSQTWTRVQPEDYPMCTIPRVK